MEKQKQQIKVTKEALMKLRYQGMHFFGCISFAQTGMLSEIALKMWPWEKRLMSGLQGNVMTS